MLQARQGEFDVESFAKVVWMMGRAHHNSVTAGNLVDNLSSRALSQQATPQVHLLLLMQHLKQREKLSKCGTSSQQVV